MNHKENVKMDIHKIKKLLFSFNESNTLLGWEILKRHDQRQQIIENIIQLHWDLNICQKRLKKITLNHILEIREFGSNICLYELRNFNQDIIYLDFICIQIDGRAPIPNFIWERESLIGLRISNVRGYFKMPIHLPKLTILIFDMHNNLGLDEDFFEKCYASSIYIRGEGSPQYQPPINTTVGKYYYDGEKFLLI